MVLQKALVNRLNPVCLPVAQGAKESTSLAAVDITIVHDNSVLFTKVTQCLHNSKNRPKLKFFKSKKYFFVL
jgi:hypothetical protein